MSALKLTGAPLTAAAPAAELVAAALATVVALLLAALLVNALDGTTDELAVALLGEETLAALVAALVSVETVVLALPPQALSASSSAMGSPRPR